MALDSLEDICRVCLSDKDNLISLFEVSSIKSICEKIEHCSGIKIIRTEGHPSSICKGCVEELAICYKFLEKCCDSDKELRNLLEFHNPRDISVNPEERQTEESKSCDDSNVKTEHNSSDSENPSAESSLILVHRVKKDRSKTRHKKVTSDKSVRREELQHTCEVCGKSLSSASNLRVHQRLHSGELPFRCDQCGRGFAQQGSLAAHARRHSGERPFCCATCPAAFAERTHLRRHASVHSLERPFVCAACGKAVKSAFALKQHLRLHAAGRDHVCECCGAAFSVKGNLAAHMRARHSERSGQCAVCRRAVPNLREHMPLHTGEKPHACAQCGKRFSRRRGLQVHSRQHSAEPKFRCPVEGCSRSFRARWVLDCHVLKHTGVTPFTCNFCSKGFVRVCHLTKHLKLNHPHEDGTSHAI